MAPSTTHAEFRGPIVMIGFGSIGRGTLPLLLRHLTEGLFELQILALDREHPPLLLPGKHIDVAIIAIE